MNRNVEWELFIQELVENPPPALALSAEKALERARVKSKTGWLITIPVASVCVAVVALTTVCNTSRRFANTANSHPVLRGLARALTANPRLRAITAAPHRI